jgi:hypothetical protein
MISIPHSTSQRLRLSGSKAASVTPNGQAVPDDGRRMAYLTRATVKEWRTRLRPVLVEFFDISDRHWHQKRLEGEWADAIQKSTKQATRSRGRWKQPAIPFEDAKPLKLDKTGDAAGYPAGMPGACIPAAMLRIPGEVGH